MENQPQNLNANDNEDDAELISQILDDMQQGEEPQQQSQQQPTPQQMPSQNVNETFLDNVEDDNVEMYDDNDVEYEDYEEYQPENLSFTDKLVNELKLPAVVLVLLLFSSLFKLDSLIYKRLPSKLVSFKYVNYLVIFVVCLLYTGAYYGVSKLL